jgi:hypothetical protein
VLAEVSVPAGPAEPGQIIERRVVEHIWRRIRQPRVEVCAERAVVHGQTPGYHPKQLAIQAGVMPMADVRIRASAPLSRNQQLAHALA